MGNTLFECDIACPGTSPRIENNQKLNSIYEMYNKINQLQDLCRVQRHRDTYFFSLFINPLLELSSKIISPRNVMRKNDLLTKNVYLQLAASGFVRSEIECCV